MTDLTAPAIDPTQGAVLKHFILVWRDTHFYLVGPFETQKAALDWARGCDTDLPPEEWPKRSPNNPTDNPCYRTIRLACVSGTAATVEVRKPTWGPMT